LFPDASKAHNPKNKGGICFETSGSNYSTARRTNAEDPVPQQSRRVNTQITVFLLFSIIFRIYFVVLVPDWISYETIKR
jgi:hypothetical protein